MPDQTQGPITDAETAALSAQADAVAAAVVPPGTPAPNQGIADAEAARLDPDEQPHVYTPEQLEEIRERAAQSRERAEEIAEEQLDAGRQPITGDENVGRVLPVGEEPDDPDLVFAAAPEPIAEEGVLVDLRTATKKSVDRKRRAGVGDRQPKRSAILDLDEVLTQEVRLGGRTWHAVEPTIAVMREMTRALPDLDSGDDNAADAAMATIFPQVQRILRDPETGLAPSQEFIERHLTARNFGRLMEALNEEAHEGNAQGG